jgi:hypothetical protein
MNSLNSEELQLRTQYRFIRDFIKGLDNPPPEKLKVGTMDRRSYFERPASRRILGLEGNFATANSFFKSFNKALLNESKTKLASITIPPTIDCTILGPEVDEFDSAMKQGNFEWQAYTKSPEELKAKYKEYIATFEVFIKALAILETIPDSGGGTIYVNRLKYAVFLNGSTIPGYKGVQKIIKELTPNYNPKRGLVNSFTTLSTNNSAPEELKSPQRWWNSKFNQLRQTEKKKQSQKQSASNTRLANPTQNVPPFPKGWTCTKIPTSANMNPPPVQPTTKPTIEAIEGMVPVPEIVGPIPPRTPRTPRRTFTPIAMRPRVEGGGSRRTKRKARKTRRRR